MKITITIPKNFEDDFAQDRFGEFFDRVTAGVSSAINSCDADSVCGTYELETVEMLAEAFAEAEE